MSRSFFSLRSGGYFVPQTAAPSDPQNGDQYYDNTLHTMRLFINGAWLSMPSTTPLSGAAVATQVAFYNSTVTLTGSGAFTFASSTLSLSTANNVNLISASAIQVGNTTQTGATAGAGSLKWDGTYFDYSDGTNWNKVALDLNATSAAYTYTGTKLTKIVYYSSTSQITANRLADVTYTYTSNSVTQEAWNLYSTANGTTVVHTETFVYSYTGANITSYTRTLT